MCGSTYIQLFLAHTSKSVLVKLEESVLLVGELTPYLPKLVSIPRKGRIVGTSTICPLLDRKGKNNGVPNGRWDKGI